jgi:hypothetical protein
MSDALPTSRGTLAAGCVRVLVWCKACRHRADADLAALISAGRGDTPLREFRPSAPSLIDPDKRECCVGAQIQICCNRGIASQSFGFESAHLD